MCYATFFTSKPKYDQLIGLSIGRNSKIVENLDHFKP